MSLYRSKDIVEKGFDILKNELDVMPANVRKDESLITELEKNRVMILPDGSQIVTEPTKRQKEIFKVLCA